MPFFIPGNANIQFLKKELTWKSYSAAKVLPTTKRVKLINKKKFAQTEINKQFETFVVYIAALKALLAGMAIYPSQKAQISALIQDKALTKVSLEYEDYINTFLFDLAIELSKNIGINKYAIELQDSKQPPYRSIYSLGPVKLETLKTYIKTYLKTGFIQPSKSPADTFILFDKKPDNNFWLCVNYRGLNNFTIKN